jgi:DNA-binding XRE family transcriptional regulator
MRKALGRPSVRPPRLFREVGTELKCWNLASRGGVPGSSSPRTKSTAGRSKRETYLRCSPTVRTLSCSRGWESGRGGESQEVHTTLGLRGPFVIRLRGRIPHPAGYPETLRTLADHLKKARLDHGMLQRDAARAIGCSPLTFLHWEKGRVAPDVRFWPAILRFLGYAPARSPKALVGA